MLTRSEKLNLRRYRAKKLGELYIDQDTTYEFDYWQNGFEGCNSLGGWLKYKEIEYLIFPKQVESDSFQQQDLVFIKSMIESVGEFSLEVDKDWIKLNCYK